MTSTSQTRNLGLQRHEPAGSQEAECRSEPKSYIQRSPAPATAQLQLQGRARRCHSLSTRLRDRGLDLCFRPSVSQRHLNACRAQGLPFAEDLCAEGGWNLGSTDLPTRHSAPLLPPKWSQNLLWVKDPFEKMTSTTGTLSEGEVGEPTVTVK